MLQLNYGDEEMSNLVDIRRRPHQLDAIGTVLYADYFDVQSDITGKWFDFQNQSPPPLMDPRYPPGVGGLSTVHYEGTHSVALNALMQFFGAVSSSFSLFLPDGTPAPSVKVTWWMKFDNPPSDKTFTPSIQLLGLFGCNQFQYILDSDWHQYSLYVILDNRGTPGSTPFPASGTAKLYIDYNMGIYTPYTIPYIDAMIVTALPAPPYISLSAAGLHGTTDPAPGNYTVNPGGLFEHTPGEIVAETFTATAIADPHWHFAYWLVDGATVTDITVTVDTYSNHVLVANFEEDITPPPSPMEFPWWLLLLLGAGAGLVYYSSRKKKRGLT